MRSERGPRLAVVGLVGLALMAVAACGGSPAGRPAHPSSDATLPLSHTGTWITDASGRTVILHGLNLVNKRAPYEPEAAGFTEADAKFLARNGFDAVRLGVLFEAVEPRPGVMDGAYLDSIERTVDLLATYKIVSLLDFHQDAYNEEFDGEGFPSWAVDDNGLPLSPQGNSWAANEAIMPAVWAAYSNFWANVRGPGGVGLQQRFVAAWGFVAQRFRSNPAVVGYELMNEPFPGTGFQACAVQGCPAFDATLTAFYRSVTRQIRAADPSKPVFVEPNVLFDFDAPTHLGAVDPNAVFSFHPYCQGSPTTCGAGIDTDFAAAQRYARANGNAQLVTEFGASLDPKTLAPVLDAADTNMVGWLEWSLWNHDPAPLGPDGTTLVVDLTRPPTGSNVRQGLLDVLARPYPSVVAGIPHDFGYDPGSHSFHLSWSTTKAAGGTFGTGAVTAVEMPAVAYPHGYGAHVTGGRVTSPPGASVLVVAQCQGARQVTLTVDTADVSASQGTFGQCASR